MLRGEVCFVARGCDCNVAKFPLGGQWHSFAKFNQRAFGIDRGDTLAAFPSRKRDRTKCYAQQSLTLQVPHWLLG
jgi:hypothetical protein